MPLTSAPKPNAGRIAERPSPAAPLVSLLVFCCSLAFGLWLLKSSYEKKDIFILLFFALQLFSIHSPGFNYVFSVGLGYYHYWEIPSMRHTSSLSTISNLNLGDIGKNMIGVNLISALIVAWIGIKNIFLNETA